MEDENKGRNGGKKTGIATESVGRVDAVMMRERRGIQRRRVVNSGISGAELGGRLSNYR